MLANNFPGSHLQINVSRAVPQSATPPVKTHLDTFLKDLPTNGVDSNPETSTGRIHGYLPGARRGKGGYQSTSCLTYRDTRQLFWLQEAGYLPATPRKGTGAPRDMEVEEPGSSVTHPLRMSCSHAACYSKCPALMLSPSGQ